MLRHTRQLLDEALHRIRGYPYTRNLVRDGLRLGDNVYIGRWTVLDPSHPWLISIGSDTTIGPRCYVLAHDASMKRHLGRTLVGRVEIGSRVFVGAGSIILPGVQVGDDAVVGAGSVVRRDVPDGMLAVGNPAELVSDVDSWLERQQRRMSARPVFPPDWTLGGGITDADRSSMWSQLVDGVGFES